MTLVAIGTASFGKADDAPLRVLREAGVEIRPNTLGRTLDEDETLAHVQGADGWIAGAERVSRRVLEGAPRLRAVARVGVGLDTVDLAAAEALGVAVSRTPDAPTDAVAEMTLAALLSLCRGLGPMSAAMREGRWERVLGSSVQGKRVLVVGHGRIGRRTAELVRALGAVVLVCDPADPSGITLEEGLAQADVVSLHAEGGQTILDAAAIARMRKGALLLNSARGELVDETALLAALDDGRIAGCWLDVFRDEPYRGPLAAHPKVLATPHAATFTRECRLRMELEAAHNVLRDLARAPSR